MRGLINHDFDNTAWLLIIEDEGPDTLGRVLGYAVFDNEADANGLGNLAEVCDRLELGDTGYHQDHEVMTFGEFINSYGNRMPLRNRYREG